MNNDTCVEINEQEMVLLLKKAINKPLEFKFGIGWVKMGPLTKENRWAFEELLKMRKSRRKRANTQGEKR